MKHGAQSIERSIDDYTKQILLLTRTYEQLSGKSFAADSHLSNHECNIFCEPDTLSDRTSLVRSFKETWGKLASCEHSLVLPHCTLVDKLIDSTQMTNYGIYICLQLLNKLLQLHEGELIVFRLFGYIVKVSDFILTYDKLLLINILLACQSCLQANISILSVDLRNRIYALALALAVNLFNNCREELAQDTIKLLCMFYCWMPRDFGGIMNKYRASSSPEFCDCFGTFKPYRIVLRESQNYFNGIDLKRDAPLLIAKFNAFQSHYNKLLNCMATFIDHSIVHNRVSTNPEHMEAQINKGAKALANIRSIVQFYSTQFLQSYTNDMDVKRVYSCLKTYWMSPIAYYHLLCTSPEFCKNIVMILCVFMVNKFDLTPVDKNHACTILDKAQKSFRSNFCSTVQHVRSYLRDSEYETMKGIVELNFIAFDSELQAAPLGTFEKLFTLFQGLQIVIEPTPRVIDIDNFTRKITALPLVEKKSNERPESLSVFYKFDQYFAQDPAKFDTSLTLKEKMQIICDNCKLVEDEREKYIEEEDADNEQSILEDSHVHWMYCRAQNICDPLKLAYNLFNNHRTIGCAAN